MVVTLEVSKLSGRLNNDARCRESNGGHTVRVEVQSTGRREAAGDRGASGVQRRARLQIRGRAREGAHPQHAVHVRDAGRVEDQRLVERRRALPRVERRACGAERGVWVGGQQTVDDRGARSVQGRARLQIGNRAREVGHPEHVAHGRDAGGVEAQRLVERRRVLPRVARRAYGVGQGAKYREARGGGRPRCTQRAGEGSTGDWEQATGRSARRTCSAWS